MELEQVLASLSDGARQILQADGAAVHLLDESAAATLLDEDVLSGHSLIIGDACTDPRAAGVPGDCRSILCAPLMHEADCLGVLHVYAAAPERFTEQDVALLAPLADVGAAAIAAVRLAAATEALEGAKARFLRVATHELRAPVTVAQSLVRGVLKGYAGELTGRQAEMFGRVSRRLDFLESLIDDLLDLAAGRAPELAEAPQAVAVNASLGRAVLLLQPRAEEKGVDLAHRVCCEELVVRATEEGLDRMFVNLIGNAVKYTAAGGSVTVGLRREGDEVTVEVADTGIGIPEEALPHLFDEFYRAPNAKQLDEAGTGLGLTIVKDLVERYRGSIVVESQPGSGSTFTVTFPVADW